MDEEKPSERFVAVLMSFLAGLGIAAICTTGAFADGFPYWAEGLIPSLLAVVWGLRLAYIRHGKRKGRAAEKPQSPGLQGRTVAALTVFAVLFALLEQQFADRLYAEGPLWLRATGLAFLVAFGISELGSLPETAPLSPRWRLWVEE